MAKRKPARAKAARNAAPKSRSRKVRAPRSRSAAAKKRSSASAGKTARRSSSRSASAKPRQAGKARKAKKAKKAKKVVARSAARKAAARKAAARKTASRKTAARKTARPAVASRPAARNRRPPTLDRERRSARESDMVPTPPSSLDLDRDASSVRSGREELRERLEQHTSTGPSMTAGDIDADWASAESVGDEAPGGDNPTPDQDVVDEIGHALGVEYDDDEELKGGEEISARDKHRWELDPASSDDYDDRE